MRRPTLLIAVVLTSILLTACLGLPDEQADEAAEMAVATTVAGRDAIENGTESSVETAESIPAGVVTENDEPAGTLAGCPSIADAPISLETPIPDASAAQLVGLTESAATACAEDEGWQVRVVSVNGEDYMVTADYRADRVNLTIVNGVVTAIIVG